MCDFEVNQYRRDAPRAVEPPEGDYCPRAFHKMLPGYQPTPLRCLPSLARDLGIAAIYVKDESFRFGLNAFKVLGASYAIYRWLARYWPVDFQSPEDFAGSARPLGNLVFCTATDGNHGRAVAWTSRLVGCRAAIYVPRNTVPARIESIRREKADVTVIEGSYDDAVMRIRADAVGHGWQIVSDTSWPGYLEIPTWIQDGYRTLFEEVDAELEARALARPDVVVVPGGVGALAAAAARHYRAEEAGDGMKLVCVEPLASACLLQSARSSDGRPCVVAGNIDSIMAGLNCGTPSPVAWPHIREAYDLFVAISDTRAEEAVRRYYRPAGGDAQVISGESGAAALGGLLAIAHSERAAAARRCLQLGPSSRVLLLSTEGATDPRNFARIVAAS
jgi:diaminopropionate ammonia-lyase